MTAHGHAGGTEGGRDMKHAQTRGSRRGFSLVELMVVVAVMFIVAAMAIINIRSALPSIRANAGLNQVVAQLRFGREAALAQRRNIQLTFPLGAGGVQNQIQLTRLDVVGFTTVGTTVISTIALENQLQFTTFVGVPDTPDGFGNNGAIDFGGSATLMFMSDGTFVDAAGNPLNGTLRFGTPGNANTARAVTILGATGRIRGYRWNGSAWLEQ